MRKNLFIFNSKYLPAGLLFCVLLVLSFELFNAIFDDHFYSARIRHTVAASKVGFEALRMKVKNEFSQTSGNRFDVLVMGDCYNIVGVIPRIIETETELSTFNFSTHLAQTVLASYVMLENYLRENATKPKFLILGFLPITLGSSTELGYLYEFKDGNMAVLKKEFGLRQAIRFSIPSLKHQSFWKEFVNNPLSVRLSTKAEIDDFIETVYLDSGYYAWRANAVYRGSMKETDAPLYEFKVSDFSFRYLMRILDLAEVNNIKVIYIFPTHPPDVYQAHLQQGLVNLYEDFLESLIKKYPGMTLVKPQHVLNDKSMYINWSHLNSKGAAELSNFLAFKLNEMIHNSKLRSV